MKAKLLLCLFLFAGCTSTEELAIEFQDLERDFPKSEVLVPEVKGNYELYDFPRSMIIKDSLIFIQENTPTNFGRCFHMESGKELATIINKGKANFEMLHVDKLKLWGDSIAAISGNPPRALKIYSINDILNVNHNTQREFILPDTTSGFSFEMIGGNSLVGVSEMVDKKYDEKYYISNGDSVTFFGKVSDKLIQSNLELDNRNRRGACFCQFTHHNGKVVAMTGSALQLEVINVKTCKIEEQRFYNRIDLYIEKNEAGVMTQARTRITGRAVAANDKHIFVICLNVTDPEKEIYDTSLLVFDWKLNPVKKYVINEKLYPFYFTEGCDFLYALQTSENEEYHTLLKYTL